MGCDIHGFTEVKIAGEWHAYTKWDTPRNYELFSALAGVRMDDDHPEPVCQPKGLPADASASVKMEADYDGADGHSHSWLTLDEMREACRRMEESAKAHGYKLSDHESWWQEKYFGGYILGNSMVPDAKYMDETRGQWREAGIEDVRYVFWFDS